MFEQGPHSAADEWICSARGCRAAASTDLQWRNPRLHDAARVKHWLACDAHADQLADFLSRRGFLLDRRAFIPGEAGSAADG